jgi:flagellar protein FlaG
VTIMVSHINTEDMLSISDHRMVRAAKVVAVAPVKPLQDMPQSGNELPSKAAATDAGTSKLDAAVNALNDHVQTLRRELNFSIDESSGRTVIKVLDTETKQIIRQIPTDEALTFARKLSEGADLEIVDTFS